MDWRINDRMFGAMFIERVSLRDLRQVCGYGVDLQLIEVRLVCNIVVSRADEVEL